jgi:calnexin
MFGPDKCGETDKVHFIFRHQNPKTGEFEEKHSKQTSCGEYINDKKTHVYTLIVSPDNTYEILIDQEVKTSGSLLSDEDFKPPVNPPSEIDDPDDRKPDDWDEREKISDPEATKPDDWDEDAPAKIPDPDATKPEDWNENEPEYIDDPDASKPSDWDEDEDGEWEAPQIPNPKCDETGCGPWKPPVISNPEYKGKWKAPMIDNPNYKGKWKPRRIPNPDFFEDKNPFQMTAIAAIGLELWSMSNNIYFDNFLVTSDRAVATQVANDGWKKKAAKEGGSSIASGMVDSLVEATHERPWLWGCYALVLVMPFVLLAACCCRVKKDEIGEAKKTDEPQPDDPHKEEEEKEETKEDVKEDEGDDQQDGKPEDKEGSEEKEETEEKEGIGEDEIDVIPPVQKEIEQEPSSDDKPADAEEAEEEPVRRSPRKRKPRKET